MQGRTYATRSFIRGVFAAAMAVCVQSCSPDLIRALKPVEALSPQALDVAVPPPPTVVLATAVPTPTSTAPIPVTVTFSSPVVGFDPDALTLVNATVANFTGSGSTYTFELVPSAPGPVTVSVAEGVAMLDAFPGIVNEASDPLSMTYDSSAPASPSITIASGVSTVYSQTIPVQLAATETTSTPIP